MRAQLIARYELLAKHGLNLHAKDFFKTRARKQSTQFKANELLHEHTAIEQYVRWHGPDGRRLPATMRGVFSITDLKGFPLRPRQLDTQFAVLAL
jgi:hypothetical protein